MSRSKIKAEGKIRIAKACASGALGRSEAARQIGVDKVTIRDWGRQYQVEGESAFLPRETNRNYSPELKEAAVLEYLAGGGSQQDICPKYRIRDRKMLKSWIKVYNGHKDFKKQTGGSRMTKGRETTQAERIAVPRRVNKHPIRFRFRPLQSSGEQCGDPLRGIRHAGYCPGAAGELQEAGMERNRIFSIL